MIYYYYYYYFVAMAGDSGYVSTNSAPLVTSPTLIVFIYSCSIIPECSERWKVFRRMLGHKCFRAVSVTLTF